jgi:hypothetical protein
LHRFDDGTETFATNTGGIDAFLGVTVFGGEVLIGDFLSEDVERFSPDGTYLGTFGIHAGAPSFIESDSNGNVYTTYFQFAPTDPEIAVRLNSAGVVTGTFGATAGIDADALGNVYTIHDDDLVKYSPAGVPLGSVPVPGNAFDLAIDEAGNRLFVANQSNNVLIYDISGPAPAPIGSLVTPPSTSTTGVHFAAESGNVLVTDVGTGSSDPRGLEYSPSFALLREYRDPEADQAWDIVTMIPEPGSLVLLIVGAVWFAMKRGGWRR